MAVSSAQVFRQDECSPLPFGGYDDAMFIDPPDSNGGLLCPVCLLVLREPHLLSCCGKHLCQVCIVKVKNDGKPCPCCNGVEFVTMLDKGKNASILSLKIYCTNKDGGCQWTGELGDNSRHLKERCDYVLEDCPFACGQSLPRNAMEKHKSRQCIKRPIEVQLECLSQDMEEKLRTLESRYEDKMAALESNITTLETTIHEQKKKMGEQEKKLEEQKKVIEEQEKKMEEQGKKIETQLLEQAEHHKQQKLRFDEKIGTIETKITYQVVQQAEKEDRKLATQEKWLTKAEGILTAQSKELKTVQQEKLAKHQLKLNDHEKQLVSLNKELKADVSKLASHDKQLNELKKHNEKLYSDIQKQQERMEQAEEKSTKQFASLEVSSTSCKDELKRIDQQLKKVDARLSCEDVIPVPAEKAKFICKGQLWKQIFANRDNDDVLVKDCLNDPNNPAIKLQIIPLEKKLAKRKSEISELVSSVVSETITFQPEQLMIYQFLFESTTGIRLGVPYSNSRLAIRFEKEHCAVHIIGIDCAAVEDVKSQVSELVSSVVVETIKFQPKQLMVYQFLFESTVGKKLVYSNPNFAVRFEKECRAVHIVGINRGVVKDEKSRLSELVSSVVIETVVFPPEKTEVFKYLFEGKGLTVIAKLQELFCVEISTKEDYPCLRDFTVQIVGVRRYDVKNTSLELVDFKENCPVQEEVKLMRSHRSFREIEEYAHSKSVTTSSRLLDYKTYLSSRPITLQGGKHDVALVKDYIFGE